MSLKLEENKCVEEQGEGGEGLGVNTHLLSTHWYVDVKKNFLSLLSETCKVLQFNAG